MPQPGQRPVTITVSFVNNTPQVDKDPVTLPASGDEVVFVASPSNLTFDVHFQTTPFEGNHFHNRGNDSHRTGKVKNQPGQHKYTVTVNGVPLDPVIIVD